MRAQHSAAIPASLAVSSTPLQLEAWSNQLAAHPDREFAHYIISSVASGFRIGFGSSPSRHLVSARRNLRSAYDNPMVVDDYLTKEREEGRLLGPISQADMEALHPHISPFGVIPKRRQQNKWRLIVDLSSPRSHSVNDGIDSSCCSIQYSGLDQAVAMVNRAGRGAMLAKLDLKCAYRAVPVHPKDRHLLAVKWRGDTFLDAALPFGLRSAPKVFSALADALLFIMARNGVESSIHYLDDFLFVGPPSSDKCAASLASALAVCKEVGFPVASEKIEGPACVITFLGIEIDTLAGELRLPADKLAAISTELGFWMGRKNTTKRELLSLIGLLQHASFIVKPGRAFLRRLIDRSKVAKDLQREVRLHLEARSDIAWWHTFIHHWNGISLFPVARNQLLLTSDASGVWGCGAYIGHEWFQMQWPRVTRQVNIATKEMVPVLFAAAIWGPRWATAHVTCRCDNAAVVAVINKGSAKDPAMMHLMRCLSFFAAHYKFSISSIHLPGVHNTAADALSRNDLVTFFCSIPQANPYPSPIPPAVVDMALLSRPDWTSDHWRRLFISTLARV